MTSDWLYPVSSASNYVFQLKNRRTTDTGPASFEEMILAGGFDDNWGAYMNWKNMVKDDRIWIYYGTADGDLGVAGLAYVKQVSNPKEPRGSASIKLRWDHDITMKLIENPFPAANVRKHIHRPMAAVWRIKPPLAGQLAKHTMSPSQSGPLTPWKGKYATGVRSTITYTRPKEVTVKRRHDAMLNPLKIRLSSNGWIEVGVDVQSKRVDLAMKKGLTTIIVEAKTVSGATVGEVRSAFAQLMEYGWRVERRGKSKSARATLWALFEKEPKLDEIEFLEDHDILVSWISKKNKRVIHSKKTAKHPIVKQLG